MRALVIAGLAAAAAAGCQSDACKVGTLLVSVSLSGGASAATSLLIDVAVSGGGERSGTVQLAGKHGGTVEIDFARYPAGKAVTVTASAYSGADLVGAQSQSTMLGASCGNLSLTIGGGVISAGSDGGTDGAGPSPVADLSGADACVPQTSCGSVACGALTDGCGGSLDCGSCQLLALGPAVAQSSTMLTLEGTFAGSASVNFPGGASATATVLGPHRATVAVPAMATTGALSVTTGGQIVGALPFRSASFTPGLGNFTSSYEQTQYARVYPYFNVERGHFNKVLTGPWLYAVGGDQEGTISLASVEHAAVNADGTLSPFVNDTIALNTARTSATSVVIGSTVYIIGGYNNTSGAYLKSLEQATIAADGTLSAFAPVAGVTLVTGRRGPASVVAGNRLYIIGGTDDTGYASSTIESALIMPDGSLGSFAAVTSATLVSPRSDPSALVSGGWLYVMAGQSLNLLASVERCAIQPDGSLGGFSLVTDVSLVTARTQQASLVIGNTLYLIGGSNLTSIEQATIRPDGSLTTFSTAVSATLYPGRSGSSVAVMGNWVYVLGGYTGQQGVDQTVERASIDGNGALGSFATDSTTQLATTRRDYCTVVLGNQLYVIAGSGADGSNLTTVESATINADGTLAPFVVDPNSGTSMGRADPSCLVANDGVYVIGGYSAKSDRPLGSIEQASINPDGTLGGFGVTSASLVTPRYGHSTVQIGGYVYVIGGFNNDPPNAGFYGSIEQATLDSTGSLGAFTTSSVSLGTPRAYHANFFLDGTLYIIGGSGDTAPAIEQATVMADGTLPAFGASATKIAFGASGFGTLLLGDEIYLVSGSGIEQASFITNSLGSFSSSSATLGLQSIGASYAFGNHAYVLGTAGITIESSILP